MSRKHNNNRGNTTNNQQQQQQNVMNMVMMTIMSSILKHEAPERTDSTASCVETIQTMMKSMIASKMISVQQQMQNPDQLQPLMIPMPSTTAPSTTNNEHQSLSGSSIEFQSLNDVYESKIQIN